MLMTLLELHTHFDWQGVELFALSTPNYNHCVYIKRSTGDMFTIPRDEIGPVKDEIVRTSCEYFDIPLPISISEAISNEEEE